MRTERYFVRVKKNKRRKDENKDEEKKENFLK